MSPGVDRQTRGTLALAGAGLLFGSTFVVMQRAVEEAEPTPFIGARFFLAALILGVFAARRPAPEGARTDGSAPGRLSLRFAPGEVRLGIGAGMFLSAGYLLQTFGLRSTTTATSAFITYLLVVIVPVMMAVIDRALPDRRLASGVGLAVVGLWLLSGSGGDPFDWGETLTLACAVAFAAHLVAVGRGAGHMDPVRFTFVQVATVAVVCGVPGVALGGYGFTAHVWLAVAFTGVFATAVAFFLMVAGQRTVPSSRAALVLLLEPVSAGVLGVATGESLGWRGLGGAALILAAIAVVEIRPLLTGEVDDDPAIEPTVHG